MYQNKILNHISTKLPKVPLRPWVESWIHLSHKRTLWIEEPEWKIQKERHEEGSKGQKFQKHKKGAKWHGNEEQTNIYVYHMLRSCGVQDGSYLKTEEKMKLIFLASKALSWLWNLRFHFPKIGLLSMIKITYIFHLENPNI